MNRCSHPFLSYSISNHILAHKWAKQAIKVFIKWTHLNRYLTSSFSFPLPATRIVWNHDRNPSKLWKLNWPAWAKLFIEMFHIVQCGITLIRHNKHITIGYISDAMRWLQANACSLGRPIFCCCWIYLFVEKLNYIIFCLKLN